MTDWKLERTFSSVSGTIRWDAFGPTEADAVVLVHGTPFSSFIWRKVAPALSAQHRVYIWDMPGYGLSEKCAGQDLSLATLAEIFTELLDYWDLQRPAVLAHDCGGAVALGAHLSHGVHYAKLALIDSVAVAPWGSPFSQLVGAHPKVFNQLPARMHRALLREYVASSSRQGLSSDTLDALVSPWTGGNGQAAFYRQLVARIEDPRYVSELRQKYGSLKVADVLLCWGEDDTWIPVQRGQELAALLPSSRLRTFPGAGHLVHEDDPASLEEVLTSFVDAEPK